MEVARSVYSGRLSMKFVTPVLLALTLCFFATASGAQTYSPTVTMTITAPDGSSQDVVARESGVGTLKLKDGSEYLFRPTIHDEPFTKATIAIFKGDSTPVGEVQVTKGAAAAAT